MMWLTLPMSSSTTESYAYDYVHRHRELRDPSVIVWLDIYKLKSLKEVGARWWGLSTTIKYLRNAPW